MDASIAIQIRDLVKTYNGNPLPAIDGISFDIPTGEIFGLLGPNGAGKTTAIHIICGLLAPDTGKVKIEGRSWNGNSFEIRQVIGVVPQEIALYEKLNALENLRFIGAMYGLKGKALNDRINEFLSVFGLEAFASRQLATYSGGMRRRLNLIAGILHKPRILILDEPTVGVDVQSRSVILEFLKKLNREGITIIYTSHYMEEAEGLCSSIGILDAGKMICQGKPSDLINSIAGCANLESIFLQLTGRSLRDY